MSVNFGTDPAFNNPPNLRTIHIPYYVDTWPPATGETKWKWWVMKRARGGGDRCVCQCFSAKAARLVVDALNALEES